MARPKTFIKQDRRIFVSALIQAGEMCTKEQIAHLEELHAKALKAQQQMERVPSIFAAEIEADDRVFRAYQNAKCLVVALSMAKDAAAGMNADITAALQINDKSEQDDVERIVHEAKKLEKKKYDRKHYLQKKREAANE